MTSNRQKRLERKARASAGGRPLKSGDRYPSGKLKPQPPGPNERVLEHRRALMGDGDLAKATNPMDFALARGWITEDHHKVAARYLQAYAGARIDAPRCGVASLPEAQLGSDANAANWSAMADEDIARIFDAALTAGGYGPNEGSPEAMKLWKRLNRAMSGPEQAEVFRVVVQDSWPQWVIQRSAGHFTTKWEGSRKLLIRGLEKVAGAIQAYRDERRPDPMRQAGP